MFKKFLVLAVALVASAVVATPNDSVAYSGNVGASAILNRDAIYLAQAVLANPQAIQQLTANGYRLFGAKVEVLAHPQPNDFSAITRYTLTAYPFVSILSGWNAPKKPVRVLTLDAFHNKHIQDDVPLIWKNMGIVEVPQAR